MTDLSFMEHKPGTRRQRRTKIDVQRIKDAFVELVRSRGPMSNRQAYYILVGKQVIPKTHYESQRIGQFSVEARQQGLIDWDDIVDDNRWVIGINSAKGIAAWLEESISSFRLDLWAHKPVCVQLWCESFSTAGILSPVATKWRVDVVPCRGYSSHTFLHLQALQIGERFKRGVETHIYYFGDYDPSGLDITRHLTDTLSNYTDADHFYFNRVAVTRDQIEQLNLQTAPPKGSDTRTRKFDDDRTVELEAIEPEILNDLVESVITDHVDEDELTRRLAVEKSQRETGRLFLDAWRQSGQGVVLPSENSAESQANPPLVTGYSHRMGANHGR